MRDERDRERTERVRHRERERREREREREYVRYKLNQREEIPFFAIKTYKSD